MDFDELAEATHDQLVTNWFNVYDKVQGDVVSQFVSKYRDNLPCKQQGVACGSFNWVVRFEFEDGVEWIMRFPVPGKVVHPEEKMRREVDTIKFLEEQTSVPTPKLIAFGMADELGLGPFTISEYIHGTPLDKLWRTDPEDPRSLLRTDIRDGELEGVYRQVANIILELSENPLDRIGSLCIEEGKFAVNSRPLTLKMNEVVRFGGVAIDGMSSIFLSGSSVAHKSSLDHLEPSFTSSAEYFNHVAQQTADHLEKQRNSIDGPYDARRRFKHRHRFQAMTATYVDEAHSHGPFTLSCDDFRPANFILDANGKIWWIDLEWTYAAPYQMLYSPPRWLLLGSPCRWPEIPGFTDLFEPKFELFHRILVEEEARRAEVKNHKLESPLGELDGKQSLSALMRKAMTDGKFWYHELIRESFDFDDDFLWEKISQTSPLGGLADVEIDKGEMEAFVARKVAVWREYEKEVTAKREQDEIKAV